LRAGDLARPYPGVRLHQGADTTVPALSAAFHERMLPGQFFSHATAARLHGLPLPSRFDRDAPIHVSAIAPAQCPRLAGVLGHRLKAGSVTVVHREGLPLAGAVDTWCQLAASLRLDELIMVGDALVRRQQPFATMPELRAAVARYAGHRGAKRLREALEWVRPRADSPKETELRLLLVRAGLPEPEVNGIIVDEFGMKVATGDLVFRQYRVLAEYDGGQHRTDEEQYHWDVDRLDAIMTLGWRVVRINKSHLRPGSNIPVYKVEAALRAAGWSRT
jgi:hypothetical protein